MKYIQLFVFAILLSACGSYTNALQSRAEKQQPVDIRLVEPIMVTLNTDTVFMQAPCDTVFVEVPQTGSQPPVVTNPSSPTEPSGELYRDHLGVVITPASDKLITGVPDKVSEAFKHVRYMGNGYALRNWNQPHTGVQPLACLSTDLRTIWNDCDNTGMRTSMVRLNKLCAQFPEATITFVNEYFVGDGWPRKTLTKSELLGANSRARANDWITSGEVNSYPMDSTLELLVVDLMFNKSWSDNPRYHNSRMAKQIAKSFNTLSDKDVKSIYDIYFEEYMITLASLDVLPNQMILEVMNENWGRDYIEIANIQYKAAMDAHIIHREGGGNVILSTGPRQWTNRTISWAGGLLAESILEVPEFFLEYLDEVGGVVSMNLYPDDPEEDTESGFVLPENWEGSPEWYESKMLNEHLRSNYPNIVYNISETGFTSSPKERMPSQSQRVADRPYQRKLVDKLLEDGVGIVYLYQIAEHGAPDNIRPEGKFTGTAIMDDIDWWIEFSKTKINVEK